VDEAQLLLQIKSAWGDLPALEGWKNTSAVGGHCSWRFVRCDAAGRVVNLTIASGSVKGPFPDAVGGLTALAYIDVSNNSISGAFPTTLYRCASLEYLDLSQNNFSGELPSDIGRRLAKNLTTLFLYSNRFSGTVPADLGALTRLQKLALSENPFDAGELPASFKNLSKLVLLGASQCNLVRDFPSPVLEMSELEVYLRGFGASKSCKNCLWTGPTSPVR
jgi:Leucine-rich repeat (LRR) protein